MSSDSNFVKLILRDGTIEIPKSEFDLINFKDWFIGKVFEYDKADTIELWEYKEPMEILIDSMRYNKLVINKSKNINIRYLHLLGEKLCVPIHILEEIKKLEAKNDIKNLIPTVKRCYNCYAGYKESENKEGSCVFHPKSFCNGRWLCCGVELDNVEHPLRLGCKKAIHVDGHIHEKFIGKIIDRIIIHN